ncbi:MAG: hypothetical protein LUQ01_04225 [Methanolinea sp.]|nr:hypothetical protein [Methanolinea sp.]
MDLGTALANSLPILLFFLGLVILYLIIREFRLMWNVPRLAQIELEKEKLAVMKQDLGSRDSGFSRIPPEKLQEIKQLDDENLALQGDLLANHGKVERRIQRLEQKVKLAHLDRLSSRIDQEEKRLE